MAEDSPKRTKKRRPPGEQSTEIADQVAQVMQWLASGYRPFEIRKRASDEWGLPSRTAENRMAAARRQLLADVSAADRQEIAAQMMAAAAEIAQKSIETRQLSNAIGAWRLYGELAGVIGRHAQ